MCESTRGHFSYERDFIIPPFLCYNLYGDNMLSEEIQEKLAETLVDRIEELNTTILEEIGVAIKKIGKLSYSEANKLAQVLKYGGSTKKIIKKLAQITNMNTKDIKKILTQVAKQNLEFSKPYFKYRGKDFIPYKQNVALQRQVDAIAKLTKEKYLNMMNTSAFKTMRGGKAVFTPISKIYQKTLDRAVIALAQGRETYQSQMRKVMRELAENSITQVDYATGYHRRLDSSVRMNMLDGMRQLSNEMQQQLGEEFGADGVEISVHLNPAPDHEEVQGRQFSIVRPSKNKLSEWEKLQKGKEAKAYNGNTYTLDHDHKNGFRPISTMNCYHYVFSIILGAYKPQYSDEKLEEIRKINKDGFKFEGKKYTMYQGTQMQRAIETKIRQFKDRQILARASDDKEEVGLCQYNIRLLTNKYENLCEVSGLPPRKNRLSVSGYHKVKAVEYNPTKIESKPITPIEIKDNEIFISAEENQRVTDYFIDYYKEQKGLRPSEEERYKQLLEFKKNGYKDETIKLNNVDDCNNLLNRINTYIEDGDIRVSDFRLVQEATQVIYKNTIKSPCTLKELTMNRAQLRAEARTRGVANTSYNRITLNNQYYANYDSLKETCKSHVSSNWWSEVAEGNETKELITHEFGHRLQEDITSEAYYKQSGKAYEYFANKYKDLMPENNYGFKYFGPRIHDSIRRDLIYEPIRRLQAKTGLTQREIIDKYVSRYGRKSYKEMFAETFANSQLGKSNALGDELINFLIEIGAWTE